MLNSSGTAAAVGDTVATVTDYDAAQKLVSQLIAGDVPAREIAIVGVGVRTIERITGRLGYANAARSGAVNGILIGLFLSAIFVLGNPAVPMQAFIGMIFVGVAIGMILSLIAYAVVRRRRDYASVMQLSADHYEVTVLSASVGKARQVLGRAVTPVPAPAAPSATASEPPRYGERVDPHAPAPSGPAAPHASAPPAPPTSDEPPRYGERIAPERPPLPPAPPAAPAVPAAGAAPDAGDPATDADAPERGIEVGLPEDEESRGEPVGEATPGDAPLPGDGSGEGLPGDEPRR